MAEINIHQFRTGAQVRLKNGPDDTYTFHRLDDNEPAVALVKDADGKPARINITNLIPVDSAPKTPTGPQADVVAKIKAKVDEKRARLSTEDDQHTTGQAVDEPQQPNAKDDGPILPGEPFHIETPDEDADYAEADTPEPDAPTIEDEDTGTPMPADYNPAVAKAANADEPDIDVIEAESGEVEALQSEINRLTAILEKREQTIAAQTDKLTALQLPEAIEVKTLVQTWVQNSVLRKRDAELAAALNEGWRIIDITIHLRPSPEDAQTKHTRIVTLKRTPRPARNLVDGAAASTAATEVATLTAPAPVSDNPLPSTQIITGGHAHNRNSNIYQRALTSGLFPAGDLSKIADAELILNAARGRLDRQAVTS